ncbi:MFS transporter, ACS family, allantoate permease, partial [Phenoliferia sp. Uapishka_3]
MDDKFILDQELLSTEAAGADPLYQFLATHASIPEATPAQNQRLKRKFYKTILPMIFFLNLLLYIDKSTLGQASILGIYEDAHLDNARYANLNTFFYVGFGVGLFPMGYLLQRLPVGRFVSGVVFSWAVVTALHPASKSYAGLAVLRTALGFVESAVLPAIVIILNMWFTHSEQMILSNVWYIACSAASIPAGFTAYGSLHYVNHTLHPWQLFFLCLAALTLAYSVFLFFFLPDNPVSARFLTTEEKVHTIRRLRVNAGAIETKVFKREQYIEALKDPKCWLFLLHIFLNQIPNNLGNQYSLLIVQYGFTTFQSTLMSIAFAAPAIFAQLGATAMLTYWKKNSIAWVILFWYVPNTIGGILQIALPWQNKAGLLVALYICNMFCVPWVMSLAWAAAACTGHTKRIAQTQMFLFGYVVSNLISPQLWQAKYLPRYIVPWTIQLVFGWILAPLVVLVIRWYLKRENKIRAALLATQGVTADTGVGKVLEVGADGKVTERIIDKGMLDLTDRQDLSFVYPL